MRKPSVSLAESALQPELDFGIRAKARALWSLALDQVRSTVARRTPKEVSYELDVSASNLCDALAERERKALRSEHLFAVALMASRDEVVEMFGPLLAACGFELKPIRRLTPAEEIQKLREALLEFGAPGREAIKRLEGA